MNARAFEQGGNGAFLITRWSVVCGARRIARRRRSPRKTRSHLLAALYGFVKRDPPFSLMAVGGNSVTKNKRKERKNMNPLTKFKKLRILPILLALGCFALPASAGTTQVSESACSTTAVNRRSGVHPP